MYFIIFVLVNANLKIFCHILVSFEFQKLRSCNTKAMRQLTTYDAFNILKYFIPE
jgi:hypothetical protein